MRGPQKQLQPPLRQAHDSKFAGSDPAGYLVPGNRLTVKNSQGVAVARCFRGQGVNGSGDRQSTKPKVTGSNPVGRALQRRWIPLHAAETVGGTKTWPICLKSAPLLSSRIGLSLKQARGLLRVTKDSSGWSRALPHLRSRQFEAGPHHVRQGAALPRESCKLPSLTVPSQGR